MSQRVIDGDLKRDLQRSKPPETFENHDLSHYWIFLLIFFYFKKESFGLAVSTQNNTMFEGGGGTSTY